MTNQTDLIELSYLSEAISDIPFLGLIKLLDAARSYNKAHGITGILMYDNQQFGQIIEGERANVMKAWERIQSDKRHHHIELLGIREITERSFPNWLLRFYGGEALTTDFPPLSEMVGGMDTFSLDLMNQLRARRS